MNNRCLLSLLLRALFISVLVYAFITVVPATPLSGANKLLISLMVFLMYAFIEYILIYFNVKGSLCRGYYYSSNVKSVPAQVKDQPPAGLTDAPMTQPQTQLDAAAMKQSLAQQEENLKAMRAAQATLLTPPQSQNSLPPPIATSVRSPQPVTTESFENFSYL